MRNHEEVQFLITVGGYDSSIHCWMVVLHTTNSKIETVAERYFSVKHHASFIRCLTSSCFDSSLLVSSGADEQLNIYDGRNKVHRGSLMVDGDVSSLQLCDKAGKCVSDTYPYNLFSQGTEISYESPSYAIATTMSGYLYVWKTKAEWQPVLVLQPHTRKSVNIALHPHGNLGVAVGDDRMISIVDMGRGSVALTIKHSGKLEKCRFSGGSGDSYVLTSVKEKELLVIETETNKTLRKIPLQGARNNTHRSGDRVCNVRFVDDKHIICAFENGSMSIVNIHTAQKVTEHSVFSPPNSLHAHESTVHRSPLFKDFSILPLTRPVNDLHAIIVGLSSNGTISLTGLTSALQMVPIDEIEAGGLRSTCITASLL